VGEKLTWDDVDRRRSPDSAADDTDPRIHELQIRGCRATDAAQKVRLIDDM